MRDYDALKNLIISLFLKGDSLCLSADTGAPPTALQQISFEHIQTHTHAHLHLDPTLPLLIYFINVPDVSHHGVGTSLQAPSGQGQLDAELLHVGGLGDGRQSVGAPAQQEVTEGSLNGGHVRGEKVLLNLG